MFSLFYYNLRQWGSRGESGVLGGEPRRSKSEKKNLRKNLKNREKNFVWKWSEKHWELQEIPLKLKNE